MHDISEKSGLKESVLGDIAVLAILHSRYSNADCMGKPTFSTQSTNIKISPSNCKELAKGGRARWRIENETFNTLKNQGYNFEHNYGHGHENLCTVMSMIMLFAFLIDQIQLLGCKVYQAARQAAGTWKGLWDEMKVLFIYVTIESWDKFLITIATRRQFADTS